MYTYDAAVFIGRFQPFHNGHSHVVREALKIAKEVVIVIGSARSARNIRNPFTFEERKAMIEAVFPEETQFTYRGDGRRISIVGVPDYPYDENKWVASVQTAVMGVLNFSPNPLKITLIGHSKDSSSYYLKMFPFWESEAVSNYQSISATDIRETIFNGRTNHIGMYQFWPNDFSLDQLPQPVENLLCGKAGFIYKNGSITPEWKILFEEYKMVRAYKEMWKVAPFPPTFVTVDAVVVQSGHVLLVKRKAMPGAGLWALPGGFLDQDETLLDGAIRELKEETKIKVPVPVLKGSIKSQKTFDNPRRSLRGRTITTAFFIDLGFSETMPKVKGADDAEVARWVPFKDINPAEVFEDHASIIDYFTNIL